MIFIFDKIDKQYFTASNVDAHDEDYTLDELNISINVPTEVQGEATLNGNININNALKALENINLYGEVKNTNDSIIFSKYGDIVIDSQNVNLKGLVYAPFGSVTINAQNLNFNNVVIIAESIELTCPNVNANNSSNVSSFVGTTSEPLDIPYDEWKYMKDENKNNFPDFIEDFNNWYLLKDTDSDMLPDCIEESISLNPMLTDSDGDMNEVVVTPNKDLSGMSSEEIYNYLTDATHWQILTDDYDKAKNNSNFKYDPVNVGTYNYSAYDFDYINLDETKKEDIIF